MWNGNVESCKCGIRIGKNYPNCRKHVALLELWKHCQSYFKLLNNIPTSKHKALTCKI